MTDCSELLANGQLRCYAFFLNSLGMYDTTVNSVTLRNTFIIAIVTLPILLITFFSNFVLIMILLTMRPRGCVHREFGLTYSILVLFSIFNDNLLKSFFTHSLPWMGTAAIDMSVLSHRSCKYFAFLSSFLSACRINLLLGHCMLHIFAAELRAERKHINYTTILLNLVCILSGAVMGHLSPIVHGVWTISNRFVCMPDPEWPQGLISFNAIHESLFCDGIAQSIVILVACFHLRQMSQRLRPTATCLHFKSDSKITLFSLMAKQRLKLLRRQECFRVVYMHAGAIAIVKIAQGSFRLLVAYTVYGRSNLAEDWIRNRLIYFNAIFDVFLLSEMIANLLHVWSIYYWQTNMRNAFLKCILHLCRPFKKIKMSLLTQVYNDDEGAVPKEPEKKANSPKPDGRYQSPGVKFDDRYMEYLRVLSTHMNPVNLRKLMVWLEDQAELPKELERFQDMFDPVE